MKASVCIEMIYPGKEPAQKIRSIVKHGFSNIEFWGWRDKDIASLKTACRDNGAEVAVFCGHRRGAPIAASTHRQFLDDLAETCGVAQELGCRTLILLTNELDANGLVTESWDKIPPEEKRANLIQALKLAVSSTPDSITLVLEPLNIRVDHVGYYLHDMATAESIVKEVGHPRLKILCDLYHLGVMGEDLSVIIKRCVASIGYVHVADFPGRHEPGTGTGNWPGLLRELGASGYEGVVGFEYAPLKDTDASLRTVHDLWEEVFPWPAK